jgi:hypothetical protein
LKIDNLEKKTFSVVWTVGWMVGYLYWNVLQEDDRCWLYLKNLKQESSGPHLLKHLSLNCGKLLMNTYQKEATIFFPTPFHFDERSVIKTDPNGCLKFCFKVMSIKTG